MAPKQAHDDSDLVPVHGGLDALVDCKVAVAGRAALAAESGDWPALQVDRADLATVYRIADGTLSPLRGPMREAEWRHVLDHASIERGGTRYAWGIPLSLPASPQEAEAIAAVGAAALRDDHGDLVGVIENAEVFHWDKAHYTAAVYGTERLDHPGGRMSEADPRVHLVGGELRALPQPKRPEWGGVLFSPRMTRQLIREQKWERALAFQTRNPLHRAHEYALVAGAERLTRAGHFTGVVLNPLVGELKGDDVPASVRMRCYRELHALGLLGEDDSDEALWRDVGYRLADVFEVIPLDIKMFYAGPREALMHAVYRQNHGFSDLVIGRKHADAPYEDGSPIWGDFDAQEIFEGLESLLALRPCNVGFAAFYESMGRVDLTENHPGEKPFSISGTKIRAMLQAGEHPDPRILRPEIAEILIRAYAGG